MRVVRTSAAPLVWLAVALPALNPFAPGPSPQVVPLLFGGICIATLMVFFNMSHLRTVAWAWLIAAVLGGLFGLLQYFGLAHHLSPWISVAELGEAYANLRQRNQLATLTNIGVAALMWCLHDLSQRRGARLPVLMWIAGGCGLFLLVAGNAASASRIGVLQLLAIAASAALWSSVWRTRLTAVGMVALILYVIAAFALPWMLTHTHGVAGTNAFMRLAQEQGCSSRQVLWANVRHLIGERPWTGWGWGELDYAHYATLYSGERFCAILDNAHNLPLHLAVELGLPLAAIACVAAGWAIWKGAPWRATDATHQMAWRILGIIGLHSMVEYPLWYAPFQIAAGLSVIFLWWQPDPTVSAPQLRGPLTKEILLRVGTALALAAGVAFAWSDYHRASQPYLPYEKRDTAIRDLPPSMPPPWAPFRNQTLFAKLTTTPLTRANAPEMVELAREMLHYSPEPRVIEVLVEGLVLTGDEEQALWYLARYQAAFPEEFAAWSRKNRKDAAAST